MSLVPPSSSAIDVSLPLLLYVPGSTIDGHVSLDVWLLYEENIEEVYIKFRGVVKTHIERDDSHYHENVPLIHTNLPLWQRGAAYPPPGSDSLHFPFRFQLPENLPPSFHFAGLHRSASVLYAVTVVGVRPGTFHANRRVSRAVVVIPRGTVDSRLLAASVGQWRHQEHTKEIRKRLWGEYSTVHVKLSMPSFVLPLFTKIPYILEVTATTAPLSRLKADSHPMDKPIFPAPPAHHSALKFRLMRRAVFVARGRTATAETDEAHFLGEDMTSEPWLHVDTDLPEKQWVPVPGEDEKRGKGVWVQRARFQSTLAFSVPPTFKYGPLGIEYFLYVRIPFPGVGNDLAVHWPVTLVSSIDRPIAASSGSSARMSDVGSTAHTVPFLDLPPSYWEVDKQNWRDVDDKD